MGKLWDMRRQSAAGKGEESGQDGRKVSDLFINNGQPVKREEQTKNWLQVVV